MRGGASGPHSGAALAGLLLGLLAAVRSAGAASNVVIVLEPAAASAGEHRCLTRIREELLAGGFEVRVVDPGPKMDPVSIAQTLQAHSDSAASIALLGDPTLGPAEIWIVDRTGARPDVRRITVPDDDPIHAAEVLAIRTIEVLRASALQRLVESTRGPAPVERPPAPVAPAAPEKASSVAVELGLAAVDSLNGPGPAEIPVARVLVRLPGAAFVRLTIEGLGSRPRIESTEGSVSINQNLALIELGAAFRRGRRVMPIVTLGAGALYVATDGAGTYPFIGRSDSSWAAVVDGGLGILTSFSPHWGLAIEAHAFIAAPHPVVRFSGAPAGTIGQPGLAVAWTLVTWL